MNNDFDRKYLDRTTLLGFLGLMGIGLAACQEVPAQSRLEELSPEERELLAGAGVIGLEQTGAEILLSGATSVVGTAHIVDSHSRLIVNLEPHVLDVRMLDATRASIGCDEGAPLAITWSESGMGAWFPTDRGADVSQLSPCRRAVTVASVIVALLERAGNLVADDATVLPSALEEASSCSGCRDSYGWRQQSSTASYFDAYERLEIAAEHWCEGQNDRACYTYSVRLYEVNCRRIVDSYVCDASIQCRKREWMVGPSLTGLWSGEDACQDPDPCEKSDDPCCGSSDPCCGSSDACCGSSDPCCGSSDPCCGSTDPSCGGGYCGDGACDAGEDTVSCPIDCGGGEECPPGVCSYECGASCVSDADCDGDSTCGPSCQCEGGDIIVYDSCDTGADCQADEVCYLGGCRNRAEVP